MRPRQGLISALFGRLTFRWGSGGNRGAPILFAAPVPGGFGTIVARITGQSWVVEDNCEMRWIVMVLKTV